MSCSGLLVRSGIGLRFPGSWVKYPMLVVSIKETPEEQDVGSTSCPHVAPPLCDFPPIVLPSFDAISTAAVQGGQQLHTYVLVCL